MEALRTDTAESAMENLKLQMSRKPKVFSNLSVLGNVFRSSDYNGNKKLSVEEFEDCLAFLGLFLPRPQINAIFKKFDLTGDLQMHYDEFLVGLKGDMNERRQDMIERAFNILDKDGSGELTVHDLKGVYNCNKHPSVLDGTITAEQAMQTFLDGFDGLRTERDGVISLDEFKEYYSLISAVISSDDYFCRMMEQVWCISEGAETFDMDGLCGRFEDILHEKVRQKSRNSENQKLRLKQMLKFFDTDQTGTVTIDEFGRALERFGICVERKNLRSIFQRYDQDRSGFIDIEEFAAMVFPH
eukprot:TRINITY_DN781956_c0_g1_i1.p1 TRINITY_DN781956_c0_g1~~TRINITY_DN781956_c0_g1_i1.p1  ORF type:complete len:300 (+),score=98.12 TRINITY_DN781956_c0_g1_i1:78-977(+)